MSRYEARINEDDTWRIIDNDTQRSPAYYATKQEAALIEWVLNAAHNGQLIVSMDPVWMTNKYKVYKGSTDEL